ncbi:hypothetical protein CR513_31903, partial [Mucuna pruriens]
MVISIVAANYKVERVLVDQGSSTNTTFLKLGIPESSLEECLGTLIGIVGEEVEICRIIDLRTMFGTGSDTKALTIKFTVEVSLADRVGTVQDDQHTTRRCCEASLKAGGRTGDVIGRKPFEKKGIGESLETKKEKRLVRFLTQNRDFFTWTPQDMSGIDPNFLCQQLSISVDTRPIT